MVSLENPRCMLELRRDRCWVKQRRDARTAKFLWPELSQMIEWQGDGHAVLLAQRRNSREAQVEAIDLNRLPRVCSRQTRAVQVNRPYLFGAMRA